MPTDKPFPLSRVGLFVVVGILILLFGFGSTPASGNLVPTPWDKAIHVLVFAALSFCLSAALPRAALGSVAALALGIGLADELHQYLVPTRQPGFDDWLADAAGTFCGLLLWRWQGRRFLNGCACPH
jgi:VanZ family protein